MAEVNIAAVLIANLMAMTMLFIILMNRHWRLDRRVRESDALYALVVLSFISCVIDCVSNLVAGRPGVLCCVVGYATNTWLYAMNVVFGPLWVYFLAAHLDVKLPRWSKIACGVIVAVATAFLIVNLVIPVVFSFDVTGVYKRGPIYWFYLAIAVVFLVASLVVYFYAHVTGGVLKTFPLWVFLVPAIFGIALQGTIYGISTIWPFIAIACCGVVTSLQSELISRDKLTGLYNRFYLDSIANAPVRVGVLSARKPELLTILWLDLNDFKAINDKYGHAMGDKTLVAVGAALSEVVGPLGAVVRYSGDEFVVLLNTQDDVQVDACVSDIGTALSGISLEEAKGMPVSASIGRLSFDPATMPMDEALNCVDLLMYENKRAYHAAGTDRDRRSRSAARDSADRVG